MSILSMTKAVEGFDPVILQMRAVLIPRPNVPKNSPKFSTVDEILEKKSLFKILFIFQNFSKLFFHLSNSKPME